MNVIDSIRPPGQGWKVEHREPRQGICLHFDGSSSDAGSLAWFRDPRASGAGYHFIIMRDATVHQLAPYEARAYHVGVSRPTEAFDYTDGNSALVGVAVAATNGEVVGPMVTYRVAQVCLDIYEREGWLTGDVWRITGHENEAWPRGRKVDPTGRTPDGKPQVPPVLDIDAVRHMVREIGT